tara:strand:- start:896 stop:1882 length:987 start_codon:yes stop_codon:yes gene_type:complete
LIRHLTLFFLILSSCNINQDKFLVTNIGKAQGTYYNIKYVSSSNIDYQNKIDSILNKIDKSLSIYDSTSYISQLNKDNYVIADRHLIEVYNVANKVYLETDGYFDCTSYPIINEWGFYKNKKSEFDSLKITKLLNYVGFDKVILDTNIISFPDKYSIDFNALAQGYTVDIIGQFLRSKNINDYLIELGGELLANGKNINGKNWIVGVEKPNEKIDYRDRFQLIVSLENKSLATSGSYRNYIEKDSIKYSHIINPKTGFPSLNSLLSVTVIHEDCIYADAYATAFMAMGLEKTLDFISNREEIDIYLIYSNGSKLETYSSDYFKNYILN